MKKLTGITAIAAGLLLVVVPRYILPSCEYAGFPHMHCTDTTHAEMAAGGIFVLIGICTLFLRSAAVGSAAAVLGLVLAAVAYALPDAIGYCHSTRMPCNYGTVPGVRFIAVVTGLIMAASAVAGLVRYRKKGTT